MKHRIARVLTAGVIIIGGTVAFNAARADATDTPVTPGVACEGVTGWRVNGDETHLKPKLTKDGALFDGPSLLKRDITPVKLGSLSGNTKYDHVGPVVGSLPLIKFETSSPYSTVNQIVEGPNAGKVWSSKIAAGDPGGQSNPVASAADLVGKFTYTADTTVVTAGLGYANDPGNKALVQRYRYNGTWFNLKCKKPEATPTATPTAQPTVNPTPTATAPPRDEDGSPSPTPGAAAPELPKTGPLVAKIAAFGGGGVLLGLIVVGCVMAYQRRRRTTFTA